MLNLTPHPITARAPEDEPMPKPFEEVEDT